MEPEFQGKGSSLGNIFCFYKTRHILLSNGANRTVLRAVVLTQYRRVTDRRTDRRNCCSEYSACNARAVKTMVESLRAENWLMSNALPRWRAVVSGVIVFIATNAEYGL